MFTYQPKLGGVFGLEDAAEEAEGETILETTDEATEEVLLEVDVAEDALLEVVVEVADEVTDEVAEDVLLAVLEVTEEGLLEAAVEEALLAVDEDVADEVCVLGGGGAFLMVSLTVAWLEVLVVYCGSSVARSFKLPTLFGLFVIALPTVDEVCDDVFEDVTLEAVEAAALLLGTDDT